MKKLIALTMTILMLLPLTADLIPAVQASTSPDPWVCQPVYVNEEPYDPENPPSIVLGDTVVIRIRGVNLGDAATEAYLEISFPEVTGSDSYVEVDSSRTNLPNVKSYPPGSKLWAGYGSYKIESSYWHVEGYVAPWETDTDYYLTVLVRPEKAGSFSFEVKMVAAGDGYSNWYGDPQTNGTPKASSEYYDSVGIDQQGEWAYVYHVEVREPKISAEITYFDVSEGTYHPGDIVKAEAKVKNTGDIDYKFKIDYSIRDAKGVYWGVYSAEKKIKAGEILTLDDELDWTVPSEVAEGECSGRLLVLDPDSNIEYDKRWDDEGPKIEKPPGIPPSLTLFEPEINELTVTINGVANPGTPGASITKIHWKWDDGTEEDHWFPATHTYKTYGDYWIEVTAYQSDGLTATKWVTAHVWPLLKLRSRTTDGLENIGRILLWEMWDGPGVWKNLSLPNEVRAGAGYSLLGVSATLENTQYEDLYEFDKWEVSGDIELECFPDWEEEPKCAIIIHGNGQLTAVWKPKTKPYIYLSSSVIDVQNAEYLSNFGTITFDGTTYTLPGSFSKDAGSYTVTANPPDSYVFDHWQCSGGVSVADEISQTTIITISDDGQLVAVFKPKDPHLGLIYTYFPYYIYSFGEKWYPCSFYGDLDDDVTNNSRNYEQYFPYYIYIHEVEDEHYLTIQYWMYYAYNEYYPYGVPDPFDHQHDWDTTIFVTFNKSDLSIPLEVSYAYHGEWLTLPWAFVPKISGTNHPAVFVALGCHGAHPFPELMPPERPIHRPPDPWYPGGKVLKPENFSWILVFGNPLSTRSYGEDSYSLIGYNYVTRYGIGLPHPGAWYHDGYWPDRYLPELYWPPYLTGADPAPWCRDIWKLTRPPPPNVIKITVSCPVDIHVYDPYGRHIGKDYETGEIEIQIPNATYIVLPEGQFIQINTPIIGQYEIKLVGTDCGNYTFFMLASFNGSLRGLLDSGEVWEGRTYYYSVAASETGEIKVVSWEYIFEDTERGTMLKISTDDRYFQFLTYDKDYGIRQATTMYEGYVTVYYNGEYVNLPAVIIRHNDGELRLLAYVGTDVPFCYARAIDYETGNRYMLRVDPTQKG